MNERIDSGKTSGRNGGRSKPRLAVAADGLPVIEITTELHRVVDQASDALAADPDTYQKEARLVRVLRVAKNEETARLLEGMPIIRPVVVPSLRETLTRVASWTKYDKRNDAMVSCLPSGPAVEALLERGSWRGIRPITGIAEAPMFLDDGSIVEAPGYDSRSGYLYAPTCDFPKVPEHPTQNDARLALAELQDVFVDFPWRSPADAAVPVAMILSALARPALNNVPAFLVDANQKGSGKSLIVDAVLMILTGRCAPKQGYTSDPVEQDKVLGSYAFEGASFVNYDNIREPFGGAPVEVILTCNGTSKARILGKSATPETGWKGIISATGNNIVLCGDVARRVLLSRIETDLENPENRTGFNHEPLLPWVLENRGRLVVAGLTMLRAWHQAGRPRGGCDVFGSFEEWSATIAPAIVFAGGADPLGCRASVVGEETAEKGAHRTLLYWWPQIAPKGGSIKSVLSELYPDGKPARADSYDALREALEFLADALPGRVPDARKLAEALRSLRGQVVGGQRLASPRTDRNKVAVWAVENVGAVAPRGHAGSEGSFPIPHTKSGSDTFRGRDPKAPRNTPQTPHPDEAEESWRGDQW